MVRLIRAGRYAGAVVHRVNTALRHALAQKDVIDGVAVMGLEVMCPRPSQLAALLRRATTAGGPIVKKIGFTGDSRASSVRAFPMQAHGSLRWNCEPP